MPQQHHLLANLIRFGRLLRAAGVPVTPQQIGNAAAALAYIDLARREDVAAVLRATLITRREHLALFEHAFHLFWQRPEEKPAGSLPGDRGEQRRRQGESRRLAGGRSGDARLEGESSRPETILTYSAVEVLRHKPFARLSESELEQIRALILAMSWDLARRRTRRTMRAAHGPYFDWRRTWRLNLRYGGEMLRLSRRRRKLKRRPLVVLCDLSGSMERYSRILLQFVYVLTNGLEDAEAFVFGTRLTRVTPFLRRRPLSTALEEVSARARDIGGGTQIGQALKTFNKEWARRTLGRGAVVLLISDGWDRGEPALVRKEMQRLQLSCYRLIWLNPLLGSPTYEPLTRGMQAALPYIDDFLPIHNLHSLEQLGRLLGLLPAAPSRLEP
ncbi:MAG: VWA domain-containing protein [Caldilineae bacterium]|nr:MAG: VWA domain-containing protein [Caldilineae bacterium]